jgi:alpha-tubulin suppressor-like RCC1 family protein
MTGDDFTVALTRSGALYSWDKKDLGQLGHGHTRYKSRPREVIVQSDNGSPDPVVKLSTSRIFFIGNFLSRGLSLIGRCG